MDFPLFWNEILGAGIDSGSSGRGWGWGTEGAGGCGRVCAHSIPSLPAPHSCLAPAIVGLGQGLIALEALQENSV